MPAARALHGVTAGRGRAASLNRPHHAQGGPVEVACLSGAVGISVAAEHVRHLQPWTRHGG